MTGELLNMIMARNTGHIVRQKRLHSYFEINTYNLYNQKHRHILTLYIQQATD